ncbi:hypothetical protein [Qipengyuania sp. SM2507]
MRYAGSGNSDRVDPCSYFPYVPDMFDGESVPKLLIFLSSVILLLLGAALMYVIDSASGLQFAKSEEVSSSNFITIVLTALAVILAAMTLMIGALAIIGWNSIQSRVEIKVDKASEEYIKRRFSNDNDDYLQFVEDIKEDVRIRLLTFTRELQRELEEDEEQEQSDPDA